MLRGLKLIAYSDNRADKPTMHFNYFNFIVGNSIKTDSLLPAAIENKLIIYECLELIIVNEYGILLICLEFDF